MVLFLSFIISLTEIAPHVELQKIFLMKTKIYSVLF
jgi:hypothetical protein